VLATYERVWAYLSEIANAITGYVLTYIVVIFIFALQFRAAWIYDARAFYRVPTDEEIPDLHFWDFVYFSLQTLTTDGSGDVPAPRHLVTQTLVSLELLAGIILTTFLVSALFSGMKRLNDPGK
jgi:hypothetical protein